jgi:AbrB family looped-hinge helix DNA binding protein
MKDKYCTVDAKGQVVIPVALRRKHKIEPGTKVRFLEGHYGSIILQPVTEEYIDRVRGMLADGPDLLAIWEKEHREEGKHDK